MIVKKIVCFLALILAFIACSKSEPEVIEFKEFDKLCFFGDAGTGSSAQLAVADLLIKEDCDGYFYLGDVIYPSGIDSPEDEDLTERFFKPYKGLLAKAPLFIMMGNHDYKGNMDAWKEVAERTNNLYYPNDFYLVKYKELCLPVLNTTDRKFAQMSWLFSLDLNDCLAVILTGHHPLDSSGKHAKPYFPLSSFLKYAVSKADVYVAGHDHHLSYEGKVEGAHQFISGAGALLRPVDKSKNIWGESRLGYLVLEKKQNSLSFTFWGLSHENRTEKEKLFVKKIKIPALAND